MEFYNADDAFFLDGEVAERPDGMTLEIQGDGPVPEYIVVGQLQGHLYQGTNVSRVPHAREVRARWTKIGTRFVGTWTEEGEDYVFWFYSS